ncbi:MAG: isopentenyl diphosphate isomerase/L-lactate dehydrogenase-like FMN-dependent dehydrogenase [Acidimicrobiales bacterium]|jgi:isopentenyl diphosphate isomerase/L-lactate dehydrogenase-like FMN-dependent dehydrogenase
MSVPKPDGATTDSTPADDATAETFHSLTEIAHRAKANLTQGVWDYVAGATETETTLRRNRLAIDRLAFRPRVLRDVSIVDVESTFLGRPTRLPVFIAPVGQLTHLTQNGAADVAAAAAEFGIPQFHSSGSPPKLEEVAEVSSDLTRIFQLYATGDTGYVDGYVQRAEAAGCHGFCLTVDTAWYSRRERDILNRWGRRWESAGFGAGSEALAALSWADVERIRANTSMPLILKGIATSEDARLAVEHGVDVVYVSNHGGRQLDHGLGSLDVLPEVVEAVGAEASVFVDGSFMRGTDVLKAVALGADAVGLGRVACLGLAAAGPSGLVRVLELIEDEMRRSIGLLGATSLDQLDPSFVTTASVVSEPHMLSAFPLLDQGYLHD